MSEVKRNDVIFLGDSLKCLREFPDEAKQALGHELLRLQNGLEPVDFKALKTVGAGTYEIRVHRPGEFRVIYVANRPEGIYVLHAFQKKSQSTQKRQLEIARTRYAQIRRK